MKPRKYTPSKRVRNHIAKWEASDFAGQNAAFGGDAVGAKAIELMDMLGDKANAFTDNELDGLLSTYYNLSPRGFRKTLMPYIDAYAADQSDVNKKGLDLAMRDRWRLAAKKYQKGIRRRANADADLMGLSYQDPIVEQPDVIKRTNIVVPEENTEATWKGAENISPYVTGKPIIKLQPRLKLPPIEEFMEDSEWEPSFLLNPIEYKNGKLPKYEDGKDDIVYTVKKGDWLSKIARDKTSGIGTYHYLASYNNITDPDKIEIGQKIRIPKSIQKGQSAGSIEDTMIGRPQEDGLPIQQFRQTKFVPKKSQTFNKPRTIDLQLPDVVITGRQKPVQQEPYQPFEWKTPDEYQSSFVLQEPQYYASSRTVRPRTRGNVQISQQVEVPNSLRVNRLPENTRSIEELNEPSRLQYMYDNIVGKLGDVIDTVKENSSDVSGLFQTAWNGVMKHFVEDPEIKTPKRTLAPKKPTKTQKPSDVLDEAFAKGNRADGDTLYWDRVPVDRTGNKYYIQNSYPLTDDMRFGSRNRGEYYDLDSNNAPLTTYRPIRSYEDYTKGFNYNGKQIKALQYDGEGHENHFMGYDKNGKFKIGPLSTFGPGDTMTQVFYNDIIGVPRDQNGNIMYTRDVNNPSRFVPVVDEYEQNMLKDGKVVRGPQKRGALTTMTERYNTSGRYGNVSGGRVLLIAGKEKRVVEGSIDNVIQELELMIKNHKGSPVRYYQLDNGSYNRGLRTRNGKNITAQDLKDYDKQNTARAGGGHFMFIRNK